MITIELIESINYAVAVLGIATFLAGTVLIVDLKTSRDLKRYVEKFGMLVAFLITVSASAIALMYSDVFGFIPCGLCWLQRVFLFSQPFVIATGIYIKDTHMPRYGIVLSTTGLVIGLYQHYLQIGGSEFVRCPVAGAGADCADRILFEFGFVTYPLLSAMLFAFLIALYYYLLKIRTT
jgi:disulfide bond formation protein DsbB